MIRAIAPSDEAVLLAAFERLGPQARYWRFMGPMGEPDRKRLDHSLVDERGEEVESEPLVRSHLRSLRIACSRLRECSGIHPERGPLRSE